MIGAIKLSAVLLSLQTNSNSALTGAASSKRFSDLSSLGCNGLLKNKSTTLPSRIRSVKSSLLFASDRDLNELNEHVEPPLPRGTWKKTCNLLNWDGETLTADCKTPSGESKVTSLDIAKIKRDNNLDHSDPISLVNQNGDLTVLPQMKTPLAKFGGKPQVQRKIEPIQKKIEWVEANTISLEEAARLEKKALINDYLYPALVKTGGSKLLKENSGLIELDLRSIQYRDGHPAHVSMRGKINGEPLDHQMLANLLSDIGHVGLNLIRDLTWGDRKIKILITDKISEGPEGIIIAESD